MIHQDSDSDNRNSVTSEYSALSQRVLSFSLDQAGNDLPFSRRVARENGWSTDYTWRVIEEYKRFAFLATVAGHPATPSDPVDQVWHLHLSYSRSYWEDFCPNVLGKTLHHEPTRGGYFRLLGFRQLFSEPTLFRTGTGISQVNISQIPCDKCNKATMGILVVLPADIPVYEQ